MPLNPHNASLQLRVKVASAIQRGHGDNAKAAMLGIMKRTFIEMSSTWDKPQ